MEISGLLGPIIIIYKEFKCFFPTYVYKSLIRALKLHGSKTDKNISELLSNSACQGIGLAVTLKAPTPQNGQTHSNNSSTKANELFGCV